MQRKKVYAALLLLGFTVSHLLAFSQPVISRKVYLQSGGCRKPTKLAPERKNNRTKTMRVRLTVYWSKGKGTDRWTKTGQTSTGRPLNHKASVAVDPSLIPYGSVVKIPNVGDTVAVDTGTDVKAQKASRGTAPVVDLYFEEKTEALQFAKLNPPYVLVTVMY